MIQFKEDVEQLGEDLVKALREELLMQGHKATGKLSESFKSKVSMSGDSIILTIEGEDYGKYVDSGRRAGKMPPIQAIFNWVKTKGIASADKKARSIAFAIATAIAREGIPTRGAYRHTKNGRRKNFIKFVLNQNKDRIESTVKLFGEKAIQTITERIKANKDGVYSLR